MSTGTDGTSSEPYPMKTTPLAIWRRLATARRASLRRLGHEAAWVAFGQVLAALGGLVGVRILTGLLDPSSYGELSLALTFATLTQQVVLGPLAGTVLRFLEPALEERAFPAYWAGVRRLATAATVLVIAVSAIVGTGMLAAGRLRWGALILTSSMFALLSGYGAIADAFQNAARQRALVALHQGATQWARVLLAAALLWACGHTSGLALLGYALGSGLVLASQAAFVRRGIIRANDARSSPESGSTAQWTARLASYAFPFAIWGVFTWAYTASDRWALQLSSNLSTVGEYAVLYQLGYYPIALAAGSMTQLLSPILFRRAGDASDRARMDDVHRLNRSILLLALGLVLVATLSASLLHTAIFRLLVSPQYHAVSGLLPLAVLAGGLFAAGQLAVLALLSETTTTVLLAPKIGTAILGICLNVLGARFLGIPGVLAAGVAFSSAYLVWILLLLHQRRRTWAS
jgi:O-antigen/teichoic acid export membrane protein